MKDQFDDLTGAVQWRWITLGFLSSGLGLALLVADSALEIGYILSFDAQIRKLLVHPAWRLGVGGGITALTFFGSWLLWRRLPGAGWQAASRAREAPHMAARRTKVNDPVFIRIAINPNGISASSGRNG